ncbi:5-methylcytosine restriction system specificity protein McrC [Micromonospora sp. KLBMP9576]|uniref:5-methylcytosine restriction system specificity protein McrC n=1 Tax=Micromonospora sp. KLBMP9576 TaxID=3424769 RepID=UPI003D8A5EE8
MIELTEYETRTIQLSQDEAYELSSLTRGSADKTQQPRVVERLAPTGQVGVYDIQPGPYVGRFRLRSGRVVDISSRFAFRDLALLLGLGGKAALLRHGATSAQGGAGLMDLIALAFVREAERVAGQGLAKGYKQTTVARPPYAGVPAVTAHLNAHAGRADRLVTTTKRLTADIELNRLIASAHGKLCQLTYQDKQLEARLRQLAPVFRNINAAEDGSRQLPMLPARYREIHDLARLVLDHRTALPDGSGVAGVGVLFNMTKVWESYVGRWLRTHQPEAVVHSQYPISLVDIGPARRARADYVVELGGRPAAVYDAKYRPWKEWPNAAELYQLFTYASRLCVDHAALVYPGTETLSRQMTMGNVVVEAIAVPIEETAIQDG